MEKTCANCGNTFNIKPSHYNIRVNCSEKCMSEYFKTKLAGALNPNYKNAGKKVCIICNKEYKSYQKTSKYCSRECYKSDEKTVSRLRDMAHTASLMPRKERQKKGISCTCKKCGVDFRHRIKKRYCNNCADYGKRSSSRICIVCNNAFYNVTFKKTCSKPCLSKYRALIQKGEKSHKWQGGKTSEAMIIRTSLEYKEWRTKVFERDNYTCQNCNSRGNRLSADHIKPFCNYPELRFDINNGKTLCVDCHRKTPTWGYKAAY